MTNIRPLLLGISFLFAAGCASEVGGPSSPPTPRDLAVPQTGDWDEAKAASVDPCGGAPAATCEGATNGVCGMISTADGDACLPLFVWGVTPDGRVQFGSSERLFYMTDLAQAPLSEVERSEAAAMSELIVEGSAGSPIDDADGVEPLTAINHSYSCSTTPSCYFSIRWVMMGHYNGWVNGVWTHIHIRGAYENYSSPEYYCNVSGRLLTTQTNYCGTP